MVMEWILDYGCWREFILVWDQYFMWVWLAEMFLRGLIKQTAFEEVKACCVRMFTMHVIFIPRIDSGRMAPYVWQRLIGYNMAERNARPSMSATWHLTGRSLHLFFIICFFRILTLNCKMLTAKWVQNICRSKPYFMRDMWEWSAQCFFYQKCPS